MREILGDSANVAEKFLRAMRKDHVAKPRESSISAGFYYTETGLYAVEGANPPGRQLSPEEKAKRKAEAEKQQADFLEKLSSERIKRHAELAKQPLMKLKADLLKQFEAVLTPAQLAAYQDAAVHSVAEIALRDPLVLHKIAVSDDQIAKLQRLSQIIDGPVRAAFPRNGREGAENPHAGPTPDNCARKSTGTAPSHPSCQGNRSRRSRRKRNPMPTRPAR